MLSLSSLEIFIGPQDIYTSLTDISTYVHFRLHMHVHTHIKIRKKYTYCTYSTFIMCECHIRRYVQMYCTSHNEDDTYSTCVPPW